MPHHNASCQKLYHSPIGRNYTDIVLKQGRLSNEYDNYATAGHTHGDYDAWGTSLSGEYGMKVGLDNGWYVTPQAQLTLMRIGGEDYTTNNGIKVNQDTLESCVGRVGFEMGKTISDKGSIYAKASLLHEFAGNADTYRIRWINDPVLKQYQYNVLCHPARFHKVTGRCSCFHLYRYRK